MEIKLANWDYYPDIMDMVLKFWQTTPYGNLPMDQSKASDLVISFIENPTDRIMLLAVDDEGRAVGMLAGLATEMLLTTDKLAHEMAWWMEPEYRKSRVSFELVSAFEYWAKNVAQCNLVQMSTVETEQADRIGRYYSRLGYKHVERSYLKELN